MTKKQKKMLCRIIITAVLVLAIRLFSIGGLPGTLLYLAAYLIIGYDILRKAVKGILRGQVFDENFLMAVATVGAIGLAFYEKSGDFMEAVAVMLFYQIGELFQSYAVGKSRRNITALMDIRPDYANIEQDGQLTQVDPDDVPVGAVIVVQPGEKVPLDGVVLEGTSTLNTAALTGESLPRDVTGGDEIVSGCINMTGVLKIRTTRAFGESTVSRILELVENSSSHKSKSENFISKFARVYTPAVCGAALALAVLPPVMRLLTGLDGDWGTWLYRALSFLVVSCPCALVISIPLSFFAGLGGASHEGILIKGSNYLETLSKTKTVVFDKTGTLTQGVFDVTGVHHNQLPREKVLEYAALAECASSHPISRSLQRAYGGHIDRDRVTDIQEFSGNGVVAKVDGVTVAVGNDKLMEKLGIVGKTKAPKYHNQPDSRGNLRFDSKKEARRYDELMLMLKAGQIRNLRLQQQYTLQESYITETGERVRAIHYVADFAYERPTAPDKYGTVIWLPVVEDVKSRATKTAQYEMKKKLLRERFNLTITEV